MPNTRAVIFANGVLPDVEAAKRLLREDDYRIAADGGCRHALACGRAPQILIGDLDSVPDPLRNSLLQAGTKIEPFTADKNETDLELAVWHALRKGFTSILIVAGLGGRTDQTFANLALLTDPALREFDIRIDDGREEAVCIRGELHLQGSAGDVVSLMPFGVSVEGVRTEGLRFPLHGETLIPFRTRGVSNRMLSESAVIFVERGVLLCIHTRSTIGG
jgi:thiamine pyrophosphokinase